MAERYRVSRAFGDAWLKAGKQAVRRVPSLITLGERNFLLNPLHRLLIEVSSRRP